MPYTVTAETQALVGLVGDGTTDKNNYISLHTGDPGSTGTLEVTGGTYARVSTNWAAPASSAVTGSSVTLNVPSGTTITHWGLWSASSGGSFLYGGTLPAPESFGSNGTYSLTPTLTASD
jgi:hypothetical protein